MTIARFKSQLSDAPSLYERDFYAWASEQAGLLSNGQTGQLDFANLAEEIGDLGRSEFRAYVSAYRVLLLHMLKWDHQPDKRTRSWLGSINVQRVRVERVLEESPSLSSRTEEAITKAYREARIEAATETGLKIATFPELCSYELGEILMRPFDLD